MNKPLSLRDNLLTDVENFVHTEAEYIEATSIHKLVTALSPVYFFCMCILFLFISLLSMFLGIAWWIGNKVNNYVLGFAFVAVLIITAISFFTICQYSLLKVVRNKMIRLIYN
jgi:hypothetical protein